MTLLIIVAIVLAVSFCVSIGIVIGMDRRDIDWHKTISTFGLLLVAGWCLWIGFRAGVQHANELAAIKEPARE